MSDSLKPLGYSLPGSSVHGISHTRMLEGFPDGSAGKETAWMQET